MFNLSNMCGRESVPHSRYFNFIDLTE